MRVLTEMPSSAKLRDWETLLDGKIRLLELGVDLQDKNDVANTRVAAYLAAKRRNIRVHCAATDDGLVIQAFDTVADRQAKEKAAAKVKAALQSPRRAARRAS